MDDGSVKSRPWLIDRNLVLVAVIALGIGLWVGQSTKEETPQDRPILRWVAKAARNLLWIALVVEPPPEDPQPLRSHVGDDGYVAIDHGRGW